MPKYFKTKFNLFTLLRLITFSRTFIKFSKSHSWMPNFDSLFRKHPGCYQTNQITFCLLKSVHFSWTYYNMPSYLQNTRKLTSIEDVRYESEINIVNLASFKALRSCCYYYILIFRCSINRIGWLARFTAAAAT